MIDDQLDIIDEAVIEHRESVFMAAIKRCPPRATGTRALLELLDHFLPDEPIDSRLIQPNGVPIGGCEARTALAVLSRYLGSIHPATIQAGRDLSEELRK